ncbi:MAG: glycine--tRNA ligase subunit beta [Spirochaetes bacterium RBG_16_49_21]|nr:MAG: glycine--tRNA ligase subunit beta [Spirochaetes bacterium RBG_16_49_21]
MLKDANFLCELGTEEIPAGYLPPAIEAAKRLFIDNLEENRINFKSIEVYATPRRIAILASGMAETQREEVAEIKGPSVKAAYGADGSPTRALEGFLKGNGIAREDLATRDTDKGAYLFARKRLAKKKTADLLPGIIAGIIAQIPFPKRMRWSDKAVTFPRPIRYFLIILDGGGPLEIDGVASSNKTRGHYIQHNRMLEVNSIKDYDGILKQNGVIVNQQERKEIIKRDLEEAAHKAKGFLLEDEELLDTVTYLTEQPSVCACSFDGNFLKLPDIILIAEMREHQKYFSVIGPDKKLTNKFLVVSNNPPTPHVTAGNERVIAARLNDARFFYEEDRKVKLADRVQTLTSVLFHKELGSIYDKVQRMQDIADFVCRRLNLDGTLEAKIRRAVSLCKTDLVTAVVFEFPSLQGKIGRIYALEDGEDPDVADAIEEHYRPRFSGDRLPSAMTSLAVSLAEKVDNIFGSFSVGNIPKGSADPYALRRQASAIVEILIRNEINLELEELLDAATKNYKNGVRIVDSILQFIAARAKTIFSESGLSHDEIDACLSTGSSDYLELFRRARSVNEFRKNENFSRMLLSFKRMNNIVSAFRKENKAYPLSFDPALFRHEEERELYDFFQSKSETIGRLISASNYIELFGLLIEAKPIIDRFFDKVLVMENDTRLRDNRLYVLESILKNFTKLMDFSRIEDR